MTRTLPMVDGTVSLPETAQRAATARLDTLGPPLREGVIDEIILGRTGLRVPPVALGTATFGLQCDEQESRAILGRAADLGMVWLDTSTSYPVGSGPDVAGVTESIIGRWLPDRDAFTIATKVYNRTGPASWRLGLSRKHILSAVEGSLRRLGTDHIDILQLHRYDRLTPIEETLGALDYLVRSGKVLYIGCCNFLAHQMMRALSASERNFFPAFQTAQVRYNALMRGAEIEVVPACREAGVAVLPFNLLAGGLLTGKHRRNQPPATGTRFTLAASGERYKDRYWSDENFDTIERLAAVASEAGLPLATMSLAWTASRPFVAAPVIGASRPEHLDSVTDALQVPLDDDILRRIDEITLHNRRFTEELDFESS